MLRSRGGRADEDGEHDEHDLVEAVAWSISLLRPAERELLHDLTAFRGPVAMEVLDEVCGRPGLVDELSALVDVHLVDPLHEGPNSRFTLPPLVREHLDTTDGAEPAAVVRERHRRWALGVATQAVSLESAGRLEQSRRLVVPHEPDLTAALGAALTLREAGAARTLALAILPLAFSRGTTPEVCRAADAVLALVHSSGQDGHGLLQGPERAGSSDQLTLAAWRELLRADTAESAAEVITSVPVLDALREQARRVDERTLLRVTYVAVQAARSLIRREVAEEWAAEGRDLATRLGDPARQVRFETWTGMMAHQRGAHAEAAAWATRALARARTLDDPSLALAPAGLLRGLPPEEAERHTSDLPTPDQLVRRARELGDLRALDWLQPTAAFADLRAGNLEAACSHSAAALRRSRATGARLRAGPALLCLFMVALRRGDVRWAGRLQGIVGRYVDVLRPGLPPAAAAAYDLSVEGYRTAAAAHPDAASDVIWGVQLSWDEGVDAALTFAAGALPTHGAEPETHRHGPWPDAPSSPRAAEHRPPSRPNGRRAPPRRPGQHATLTLREQDVLEHLVSGGTNREISLQLGISAKTVMHHTSSIYRKLGVRGRAEAVAWSLRSAAQEEPPGARLRLVEPDV
jgi:DNA-binding CsgD family transcriptional regulator